MPMTPCSMICSRRFGAVASLLVLCMSCTALRAAPLVELPAPEKVIWRGQPVSVHQSLGAGMSSQQAITTLQSLLQASSRSGDPRFLGEAQALLNQLPADVVTSSILVQRAIVEQRLHEFDAAQLTLDQVLLAEPDNQQALITAFSVSLSVGDAARAQQHCAEYQRIKEDLAAATCRALLLAQSGRRHDAQELLAHTLSSARFERAGESYVWALSMLAEMLSQQQPQRAQRMWALAFYLAPDDLYVRKSYGDQLLQDGRIEQVLALTEGWEAVEALAVIRTIALQRQNKPEALALIDALDARFEQARERGPLLHSYEYARYLLDVKRRPHDAMLWAWRHWQTQKLLPDFRLLRDAALQSGQSDAIADETRWSANG